jgi:hypothetical protein
MSKEKIATVENYLNAIKAKKLGDAPLAEDVSFEDPLTPEISGKQGVIDFVSGFLPALKDVSIKQHIADGDYVATVWDADTVFGVLHIFECFRVVDGEIKEIRAFLDPRPITRTMKQS